ncbi:MAG: hypothetical protein RSA10_03590 [Bacilli bacterium]
MDKISLEEFKSLKSFNNELNRKNIAMFDDNYLIKIVGNNEDYWNDLSQKKIDGFNLPVKVLGLKDDFESYFNTVYYATNYDCAILIERLKNKTDFLNLNMRNYDSKDILTSFKKCLEIYKNGVDNGVVHGDVGPRNIMIDSALNPSFIDFEASIINDKPSFLGLTSPNKKYLLGSLKCKQDVVLCDKLSLLIMFIQSIINVGVGEYSHIIDVQFIKRNILLARLPKKYEKKYVDIFVKKEMPHKEDFFIDDFDDLIKSGWEFKIK